MNLAQAYNLGRLNPFAASSDAFEFAAMLRPLRGCLTPPSRMPKQAIKPGSPQERILDCLERSKKPRLQCQIRSQLRMERRTCANSLQELLKRGLIVRTNAATPYLYWTKR
jgi:hypothetical protein